MPEASVHEDSRAVRPHDDVRLAGHALHVEAVAIPVMPQPAAHLQLGFRVPAADMRHAPVPLLSCHRVGHGLFMFGKHIVYNKLSIVLQHSVAIIVAFKAVEGGIGQIVVFEQSAYSRIVNGIGTE